MYLHNNVDAVQLSSRAVITNKLRILPAPNKFASIRACEGATAVARVVFPSTFIPWRGVGARVSEAHTKQQQQQQQQQQQRRRRSLAAMQPAPAVAAAVAAAV
jgi:hypothetical protein